MSRSYQKEEIDKITHHVELTQSELMKKWEPNLSRMFTLLLYYYKSLNEWISSKSFL